MDLPEDIVCLRMIFSGGVKVKFIAFVVVCGLKNIASKLILLLVYFDVNFLFEHCNLWLSMD